MIIFYFKFDIISSDFQLFKEHSFLMNIATIKNNFGAGVVVFLISLPLSIGVALISGAPPIAGVWAVVIGGIVVGFLSGSNISVSGPAAGLSAIVLNAITTLGSFELFLTASLLAGIFQLALGFLRAGSLAEYIPISVVEGMLAGIGVIIITQQIPALLGVNDSFYHIFDWIKDIKWQAVIIAGVSFVVMIFWAKIPKLGEIKLLPAALVAVILGALINTTLNYFNMGLNSEYLVNLPQIHSVRELTTFFTFPDFSGLYNSFIWVTAVTVASVASIETLLSIEASDRIDPYRRITDNNQELRAQGTANIISSLVGGIPVTSVVIRSSANVRAGATHRMATMTHGLLMALCIILIPFLLNQIPLATLACILILIGSQLARISKFVKMYKKGFNQFLPFISTFIAVVIFDLLKGVAIGILLAIIHILRGHIKRSYYLSREELENVQEVHLTLGQEVSFLNKAAIKKTIKNIRPNSTVIIDATRSCFIAPDVLDMIQDYVNYTAPPANITVILKGFDNYHDDDESRRIVIKHHTHAIKGI